MTLISIVLTLGLVWVNLVGLSLLANTLTRNYAVSRIGAPIVFCLFFFFLEHFFGLGPRLIFLPFSTVGSGWLIWRYRRVLAQNIGLESVFAAGFFYCLMWRYAFPDICIDGEEIPDLMFIHDYIGGGRLPPLDRWLPPFRADFYYSFQHYSAALMGRWFRLEPNYCYQFSYCFATGLIAAAIYAAASRLCLWRPGRWLILIAMVLGGTGLGLVIHLSMNHYIQPAEMCRYLGLHRLPVERTAFGVYLDNLMYPPGHEPAELPVTPLSFVLSEGEFHAPLAGFLILIFSVLLIANLEFEPESRSRGLLHGLLAATIPISLISNTWDFPLQFVLVAGWFCYRALRGEKAHWLAGIYGGGLAALMAYPFLVGFTQQPLAHATEFKLTRHLDHSWLGWLCEFWPVILLSGLGLWNRERRGVVGFFVCTWLVLMVGAEVFYVHDVNSGTWERYNSTLKWWAWIYTGGALSLSALNMGARSRLCRYGSMAVILVTCIEIYDYGRFFLGTDKPSLGHLDGSWWLHGDSPVNDLIIALKARPDGICIDSGLEYENTDTTAVAIFADKQSLVGWPVQEGIWRGQQIEIGERMKQEKAFYKGEMDDPLTWLLDNHVRYVLWLQKDNNDGNHLFRPLWDKIRSRYVWRHFYGNDADWAIGFWEMKEPPGSP